MSPGPVYVWSDQGGSSVLVGATRIEGRIGTFAYAPSYKGPSIDPINLPRSGDEFQTRANGGLFGVLGDAGPDGWGRRVLTQMHPRRMASAGPLEVLQLSSGHGVGSLRFSASRSAVKPRHPGLHRTSLVEAAIGADAIERNKPSSEVIRQLLWGSSGLGGAHPKVAVSDGSGAWIAKFRSKDDRVESPLVEWACMTLARDCGLHCADVETIALGERPALLVRRFDRVPGGSIHYASAHALWNRERFRESDALSWASYAGIVQLRRDLAGPGVTDDAAELFRRLVFNLIIGNSDDHGRNHGFLMDRDGHWRLAPAFDLLPTWPVSAVQALGAGPRGRPRSLANALDGAGAFGLNSRQAAAIAERIRSTVDSEYLKLLRFAGVAEAEQKAVLGALL